MKFLFFYSFKLLGINRRGYGGYFLCVFCFIVFSIFREDLGGDFRWGSRFRGCLGSGGVLGEELGFIFRFLDVFVF